VLATERTEPVEAGSAASVSGHICAALDSVNAFLQFYFTVADQPPKPRKQAVLYHMVNARKA
jgi:hypothetical protein